MSDQYQYVLKPGCTEDEAKEVVDVLHQAAGHTAIRSPLPGWSWVDMAIQALQTPEGQALMSAIEALIVKGLVHATPVPAPAK